MFWSFRVQTHPETSNPDRLPHSLQTFRVSTFLYATTLPFSSYLIALSYNNI